MTGREEELAEVARWAEGIEQVHSCIAGRFRRPEPRRRVLDYLRGLVSSVERKNGWQLAEQAGDATPDGVQRLLYNYRWDADLVRDDLKSYVVEHLSAADAVLVVDETGFLKKGEKSVGVQRQYSGTAGRIENCQIGVFLAYASARGRTLLDRELYLPQVWAEDWERRREAGVPESVGFRTKPQLAQLMLKRALESGVPFGWVAGDEVYGNDRKLRRWLERAGIPHVLAIRSNEKLWVWTDQGLCQVRADRLTSQVDELGWTRCSAGDGAKLGFTQFKRRRQGNLQVGGTVRPGVPECRGQRPTVRNLPTPATGGDAPGRWHPRRSATVLSYQAALRWVMGCRFCNAWAARVVQEKSPSRAGVVRAMARSDHWRCVSTPRWVRTSWKVTSSCQRSTNHSRIWVGSAAGSVQSRA